MPPGRDLRRLLALLLLATGALWAGGPGFRTEALFNAHYRKHGREFGNVSKQEYLRLAQELRDAPLGRDILEARRPDGGFSRFDRRHGYFGAYNRDRTIRTFFIPTEGERYFHRQARRPMSTAPSRSRLGTRASARAPGSTAPSRSRPGTRASEPRAPASGVRGDSYD